MKPNSRFQRAIATFFLLIFFPTLVPQSLFASNNGPSALEAAGFEPANATDMVNLLTGDMSYSLPLLNIPSPEGGYPLALSYKAGIAMDQEASWTGLGWSLNPGAINRFVNGYADDISQGEEYSFVYDKGKELDFYNVGIGANYAGITAGLGAYWGSNKTLGGSVTFGYGPAAASITAGSAGTGFSLGYTNTVENVVNDFWGNNNFQSSGTGITSQGAGLSFNSGSISKNDYNIYVKDESFSLNYGINLYYGHKHISYSLFKENIKKYTGILYPEMFDFLTGTEFQSGVSLETDTNLNSIYKDNSSVLNLLEQSKSVTNFETFLSPSKDNYIVNAQALNGNINSHIPNEIRLTYNHHQSQFDEFYFLGKGLNNDPLDNDMKLNTKIFMDYNSYASGFSRNNRTNVVRDLTQESILNPKNYNGEIAFSAYRAAKTNPTSTYSQTITPNGEPLKNGYHNRKGVQVETFTNEQIINNGSNLNFIEAKGLSRADQEVYLKNSIGGYRITQADGKTYHYSLPVINFESWYKNYKAGSNEYDNFFENENGIPYTTDWLLTAITGSDYVDTNGNNILDKDDYGYWIEFEYGKWSDGYIWQTNSAEDNFIKGDIKNSDRYEYYKGRKQIYYLDAIKTRTHTAYFVKSLRKDATAKPIQEYKAKIGSIASYDKLVNGLEISSNYYESFKNDPVANNAYFIIFPKNYNIPETNGTKKYFDYAGYKKNYKYKDIPKHYSLKLDKIILVKNNDLVIDKKTGADLVTDKEAYIAHTTRCFKITQASYEDDYTYHGIDGIYTKKDNPIKKFEIHSSQNILDINDINNIDIKTKAIKTINFEYDPNYSLKPYTKTSDATNKGTLTLQAIELLGKEGNKTIPNYKFKYDSPSTPFNNQNEDGWGYNKTLPNAWSLSEITTPIGKQLKINYEQDDYSQVASISSRVFSSGLKFSLIKNTSSELEITIARNTETGDDTIEEFTNFKDYFAVGEKASLEMFICRRSDYGGSRREVKFKPNGIVCDVVSVDENQAKLKVLDNSSYWSFYNNDRYWILNRTFALTSVRHISNGSKDGVIMRDAGYKNCWDWRDAYDNDDINFHYRLASSSTPKKSKGGGLRVKEINVAEQNSVKNTQKFFYNVAGTDKNSNNVSYVSSGSTSYVPYNYPVVLPYAQLLPSANVLYKTVTVETYDTNNNMLTGTQYNFNTLFDSQKDNSMEFNLGDKLSIQKTQDENIHFDVISTSCNCRQISDLYLKKYILKDKLNSLGQLISIYSYNYKNQTLGFKKFKFKTNLDTDGQIGVTEEAFSTKYSTYNTGSKYNSVSLQSIKYPSIIESIETQNSSYNYKINYDKFDFLTGQVLETTTETSDGKKFKTRIIPAYIKSQYAKMGSKIDDPTYKNMLSQTTAEYSYIMDNGTWKETGVGITTWNNIWEYQDIEGNITTSTTDREKVWRKHKTYVWNGLKDDQGIFQNFNSTNDDDFNWTVGVGSQPSQWKQISEVTKYDHYSMLLEAEDINHHHAATKMGDNDTKITAVGNAKYNELFYSSMETLNSNNWLEPSIKLNGTSIRNSSLVHTGRYSAATTNASNVTIDLKNAHKAGKYKLNVWIHKNNASKAKINFSGTIKVGEIKQAGDWVLKTYYLDIPATATQIQLTSTDATEVIYDDVMLRPIASGITGYVYNEWDELSYVVGNNGLATHFKYDKAGRLEETHVEVFDDQTNNLTGGFKLITKNIQKYKYLQ
ncbi:hypothetical protein [Flavobacterium sp. H122]|uniref:hypothetical protein n=1 Tax=Flavobacterium sp. H122 TaxID=2529860 RepID=UPI0010AA94FB|nr:hypothetical protein [Flavobacterium sp. H122]